MALHLDVESETLRRLLLRWGGAGLCVVLAHATAAFAVLYWPQPNVAAGEPPAAVMIELAPLPAAPDVPEQELAVGPQSVMSDTSTPSEKKDDPVEKVEPEQPKPAPSEAKVEPVEEQVKTEIETAELPQIDTAEAVLEAPKQPEAAPEKVEDEKPPEPPKKTEQKKQKPQDKSQKAAQVTAAPKPIKAQTAKTNAAPSSGVSSSMSIATWRGTVMAHINRQKRSPGGSKGRAFVGFRIDRGGRVTTAWLVGSSGNPALDKEAVALVRRASPVPPPPANVKGGSILLSVPLRVR
ncbi:energy transducer TonB [Hyphomicrobium sp. LHD-15]|uniref:energy transducer TonB family protein n=1 Tax=Hyphomicrobium sp. LHD-15 TaxID=3072142 RepID=UPI00280F0D83|nr:energy transducer TonB [Hyphomicrobium sp. LHD-15]MDQ8698889.1 energy transducer TonB [Hyphomicrobium sp. LHD-15]